MGLKELGFGSQEFVIVAFGAALRGGGENAALYGAAGRRIGGGSNGLCVRNDRQRGRGAANIRNGLKTGLKGEPPTRLG